MYNYIIGKVVDIEGNRIVLDCSGIGYEIYATVGCVGSLTIGQDAKIFVFLAVKEDDMSLFGFANIQERRTFFSLTGISGIGNKTAIGILSGVSTQELGAAIVNQDSTILSKIKGVGKKTAERILLELKDKFKNELGDLPPQIIRQSKGGAIVEAQAALQALGFRSSEIGLMLSNIVDTNQMSAEELISKALQSKK